MALFLHSQKLIQIPPEIGKLSSLKKLFLYGNHLTQLPPEIGQLSALETLYLDNNRLTQLPPEIGQLSALETLYLDNNHLTQLPPEIGQLSALKTLGVAGNQLSQLPPEIGRLRALTRLFLHDNPTLGLSAELLGPTSVEMRSGRRKPASPRTILRTYFALQRGQRPLHEVKIILIGRGEVGKTSLVQALTGHPFVPGQKETPGIGIGTWQLSCGGTDIKVHLWDFAGQEITHEAHRFFLTERCLYLVVTEGRQGLQDADADHWLAHVEQYGTLTEPGKPPETSPALVVANKVDSSECPLERRRLQREHPCVRGFLETDCATGTGIAALREKIATIIAGPEMDSVRQPFPTEWQRMKARLDDWKGERRHFYRFDEFATECTKEGVQEGDQLALTHVLNQLGIALYYGKNPRLRDTRVLDPQWLANGMYALLRGVEKHGDAHRPGEMREDEITLRLEQGLERMDGTLKISNYPKDARRFLLELMEDRELCFVAREPAGDVPVYLLPSLLPKDEPEGIDFDAYLQPKLEQVRFRFIYKLLPDGLMPRFIVRTHSLSRDDLPRWRRGVILSWSGAEDELNPATALVLADVKERRMEITVQGGDWRLRQELAGIVRTHLKDIHRELPAALDPREELELSTGGISWQEVETLELAAQQKTTVQVRVEGVLKGLRPEEELEKVEPETAWQADAARRALKVFISYAHEDHKHLDRLTRTYLAVFKNEKLIEQWTDAQIRAGEDWDRRIHAEVSSADIVILLLSEAFFASNYIGNVEMTLARKRQAAGEAEIVPVLLSGNSWKQPTYDWLKKLQMTPKDEKNQTLVPLVDFPRRQSKGWDAVQEQLRKVIGVLRQKRGV